MNDPIELLARDDKWQLGGADGIVFAPPFPTWLDAPGFWDEATVYQHAFAPLFTVTALDDEGREVPARAQSRRWTPSELTIEYRLANGVTATEVRSVHPDGIFVSEWRLRGLRRVQLHLVAWTAQPLDEVERDSAGHGSGISFTRAIGAGDEQLRVAAELVCLSNSSTWGLYAGERRAPHPSWRLTPFAERWRSDGLSREVRLEGAGEGGSLFGAVHRAVSVDGEGAAVTFAMRLAPADDALRRQRTGGSIGQFLGTLGGVSRKRWHDLFGRAPAFRCSDPYFETYYWYRWYGLWLNAVGGGAGAYAHPAVCEGIAELHRVSSSSVPAQARELSWLSDPGWAQGSIRTLLAHQREDGALPSQIALQGASFGGAVAADLGGAILAIDAVYRDDEWVAAVYPGLARYAEWLGRTGDAEKSGLYPPSDARPAEGTPARSVKATVHAYTLLRALEQLAPRGGRKADAKRWRERADRVRSAVQQRLWNDETHMFANIDAGADRPSSARRATGFLPYAAGLATPEQVAGLRRTLLDPKSFWTAFPVPSVPLDDPCFSPFGASAGRVHPSTNGDLIDALATASVHEPALREAVVQLLTRFVRMMFHDGELKCANCHEHYNPITGHASMARGTDDHQCSRVNDLLIRYVLGIRPHATGLVIDPFPFGLEMAEIRGVRVRGWTVDVRIEQGRLSAVVDGARHESSIGHPIEVAYPT